MNEAKRALIERAIDDVRRGRMIMVTDDERRENEGDLICAAQGVSAQNVNFMAREACGLLCMPVSREIAARLELRPMVACNEDNHETAFTVSCDHVSTSTGISAYERTVTARAVADGASVPADFRRPGHMFPLIAKRHGVFERAGHTEATVDICRLAGLEQAGLCCEIMSADGHMARRPELEQRAREWGITLITIRDLIEYRKATETFVERVAEATLPTKYGTFRLYGFLDTITGEHHEALVMGDVRAAVAPDAGEAAEARDGSAAGTQAAGAADAARGVLCRVHSECLTGDTFGSLKCDCGEQLHAALRKIAEEGRGVLVYLSQEGRGIGILNKIKAYSLQEGGLDTVDANLALGLPADARDYYCGIQILKNLGVSRIRLMTNNPDKIDALNCKENGIEITERVPLEIPPQKYDRAYLRTKATRMGHLLDL